MSGPRFYSVLAGVALLCAAGAGYWLRGRRKSPEQLERERRLRISQHGRITDGSVLDVQEVSNGRGDIQLIIYSYDVAGVSYEASQDITGLRHRVDIHSCKLGLPTSVKYDPHNPGDSVVIAETWTGLRSSWDEGK